MPSNLIKQANAAKLSGAVKFGKFPKSKAGNAVNSMAKMPMNKFKHFMKMRESLSIEGKRKLLYGMKLYKKSIVKFGNITEDVMDHPERNSIAKTFDTKADFDTYTNQRRGIEMTDKEQQSIIGYTNTTPTQQNKFTVKYETTDDFGNNTTTVIKKLKDGDKFCWISFSRHESTDDKNDNIKEDTSNKQISTPQRSTNQVKPPTNSEITVDDLIRITKSITFIDDVDGSNILSDFLRKLNI